MKSKNLKNCRSAFLRLHVVPVLIWLTAVACIVVLFHKRTQRFQVVGIARGQVQQIAATCTGQLRSVPVELFQKVNLGDKVAVIDTILEDENTKAQRQAQLRTASAKIQHLMAEMIPTQESLLAEASNIESDRIAAQRRFSVDVENAKLRILQLKTQIETDSINLENLAVEVKIAKQLLAEDAIAPYELQKAQVLYNTLDKTIQENEHILSQAEVNLQQAQQRKNKFAQHQPFHPSIDSALDVIRKAVKVQEQLIEELLIKPVPLTLTAPLDGIVSQVYHGAGDAVLAGDPILTIAQAEPAEIIAYASEQQAANVKEQMNVQLVKNSDPAQITASRVVYLGPNIEIMPERLWRNPNVPQWGRPMLIKIPPGFKLVPGETIGVRGL